MTLGGSICPTLTVTLDGTGKAIAAGTAISFSVEGVSGSLPAKASLPSLTEETSASAAGRSPTRVPEGLPSGFVFADSGPAGDGKGSDSELDEDDALRAGRAFLLETGATPLPPIKWSSARLMQQACNLRTPSTATLTRFLEQVDMKDAETAQIAFALSNFRPAVVRSDQGWYPHDLQTMCSSPRAFMDQLKAFGVPLTGEQAEKLSANFDVIQAHSPYRSSVSSQRSAAARSPSPLQSAKR